VFFTPGVRSVLGVVFTWMLAHNILYTYIAPFVAEAGRDIGVKNVMSQHPGKHDAQYRAHTRRKEHLTERHAL
ncbi:hypothetical protein QCD79_34025, partial [Pseudomonas quasicaspiana]|nr:hypothetical protein [Pseudomonas quasicaspiana]